jgi:hypothetical protein
MKISRAMQVLFVAGACVYAAGAPSPALANAGSAGEITLCGGDDDEDDEEDDDKDGEETLCGGDSDDDDEDEDDDKDGEETIRL